MEQRPELYDPRNEEDYNTFPYGTEPIPGDRSWVNKKASEEAREELKQPS